LSPAFSNGAIRGLTPVFFDSAYKVKDAWDALLESSENNEAVIDVQDWHVDLTWFKSLHIDLSIFRMNHVS
jgi:hypothetical protein